MRDMMQPVYKCCLEIDAHLKADCNMPAKGQQTGITRVRYSDRQDQGLFERDPCLRLEDKCL